MKRWLFYVIVVALIGGLGFWLWRVWFPSPEKVIRQRFDELARTASYGPNEGPLATLANVNKLGGFFTSDAQVKIDAGGFSQNLSGRERLLEVAHGARSVFSSLKVEFIDVIVAVAPDKESAEVNLTARGKVPTDKDPQVYVLKFNLKKIGGDWLIQRVETVKTLL